MACDADALYCLNAIPYVGKDGPHKESPTMLQGQFYTMKLIEPFREAGRVVCCDNWFTSLPLAKALSSDGMHKVGTIRDKPYLPNKQIKG